MEKVSGGVESWDLPNYSVEIYQEKKSKYCICIPVINEAHRIQNQLNKMKDEGVEQLADIIICDGGSTDGSVESGFLKSVNVSVKLTKQDSGVVGAQLRMGYAFALLAGYEGIITMDGNDKDGPDVVRRFCEKLDRGYDYVQGSRYMEGGQSINTPKIRDLAIRLIHVPIIRLKSSFKYTDTTNGNRAYSSRLLKSEKISPFRSIFYYYEFLVYVSSVAPRLGFKVIEVPMTRSYPKGKVPTKISFLREI